MANYSEFKSAAVCLVVLCNICTCANALVWNDNEYFFVSIYRPALMPILDLELLNRRYYPQVCSFYYIYKLLIL